ncbi:hypothetical protein [Ostreiculturibacter nitratireducens]|uniref:hypothetical protein n=1 Tax=Ostreiculturibacter nitratireducens TaxID=3075226 RepID=UPI0031B60878
MRLLSLIVVLALIAGAAALATRPGPEEFDAMLKAAIEEKIATTDIDGSGDAIETIALVGCKLRPSDCFALVREGFDVQVEDKTFYTRFTVDGFGQKATCTGAFTKIWCSEELLEE